MSLDKRPSGHLEAISSILFFAAITLAQTSKAESVIVTNPPPTHAGWEASKDVRLPGREANTRSFRADFTFTATASNNVQVAFGKDNDNDGKLPAEETSATVGWDRGAWFVQSGDLRTVFTNIPSNSAETICRTLKMSMRLNASGEPISLSFHDQTDGAVSFDGLEGIPAWLSPKAWNTAALTARGWDVRDEAAQISFVLDGTRILLR